MIQSREWDVHIQLIITHKTTYRKFAKFHLMVHKQSTFLTFILFVFQGVDIIMDPLNGEDSVRGYDLLKPLGRIIYFGKY